VVGIDNLLTNLKQQGHTETEATLSLSLGHLVGCPTLESRSTMLSLSADLVNRI
jgi:hypothetical protein